MNRLGERTDPWGTPFGRILVRERDVPNRICACLPAIKFVIHFLSLVWKLVCSIFWMSSCLGTVSNALFISIAASIV